MTVLITVVPVILKKHNFKNFKISENSNPEKDSFKEETVKFCKDNPEWYPTFKIIIELIEKSLKQNSTKRKTLLKTVPSWKESQF